MICICYPRDARHSVFLVYLPYSAMTNYSILDWNKSLARSWYLMVFLVWIGCKSYHNTVPVAVNPVLINEINITPSDFLLPSDKADSIYNGLKNRDLVFKFYELRKFKLFWREVSVPSQADSLIFFINRIRYFGLFPQDYHASEVDALKNQRSFQGRLDLLLSDAFFSITSDIQGGRIGKNKKKTISDSLQVVLIDRINRGDGVSQIIGELEPRWVEYRHLKEALHILLDTIPILNREILLSGKTPDTLTFKSKLQSIEINLERWREEEVYPNDNYILINIPAFRLKYMKADTVFFTSRVIVGLPDKQTPLFSSKLECFVLYPFWYVPRKIAVEEYLPIIQKDSMFLQRNNFDVINREGVVLDPAGISWSTFNKNNFPVSLRQREGSVNSLGLVKFVFDNPYQVYLHDTNARRLFNNKNRALSHGCVRVENAITLAHLLVTGIPGKKSSEVDHYLQKKERHYINLKREIPIHIRYFTAESINGSLYLYDDVYKQDYDLLNEFYK